MSNQFRKNHAITVAAATDLKAHRFITHAGTYAAAIPANGSQYAIGVSEEDTASGEAAAAVTSYTYLVEASAPIALHAFVKPAADGSGKAAPGTATSHCGRALSAATAAGQLIEVEILDHTHA